MPYIARQSTQEYTAAATATPTLLTHAAGDVLLYFATQRQTVTGQIAFAANTVTATAATDVITYTGSDIYANGDPVSFTTSSVIPGGITAGATYYVRDLDTTANTFKLAATVGGAAIDITSAGNGTQTCYLLVGNGYRIYSPGLPSDNQTQVVCYKVAASSSETAPAFISNLSNVWIIDSYVVKDVDQTTPMDFTPAASANAGASSKASPSATAATDGTLLIYSWAWDAGQKVKHKISEAVFLNTRRDAGTLVASLQCYIQQNTAAAAPTVTSYAITASQGGWAWVVGLRNASGGSRMPMVSADSNEVRWYGDYGSLHDATTTWVALTDIASTIGALTVTSTAPTISTQPRDPTPNGTITTVSNAENFSSGTYPSGRWVGGAHAITQVDMSAGTLTVQWDVSTVTAVTGAEGTLLVLADADGDWEAYQLATKYAGLAAGIPQYSQIAPGRATAYASGGTFDATRVTKVGYAYHRLSGTATTAYVSCKNLTLINTVTLTGGGANMPATVSVIPPALSPEWMSDNSRLQGGSQTLAKVPIQIGDGTKPTYYDASATALAMPAAYHAERNRFQNFNANALSFVIKASASDTINLTSALMSANQATALTIHASSSASATYSAAGTSFTAGWQVDDNVGIGWTSATFSGCDPVDFGGSDVTSCIVTDTLAGAGEAAAIISANGSVITGTTIDVTGTSAGYHLELGASVTAVTLADVTFTGTPATNKVHVSAPSGTVTITISGTISLVAGDVTSAGATVVIAAPELYQSVTISGATAGSRIQIYDTDAATELYNGTPTFPYTWTDSVPAAADRPIRLRVTYVSGVTAKKMIEASIGTCGITEGTEAVSYLVNQEADDVYDLNAIDGSTVTNISIDDSTNRVKINLAATGTFSNKAIYAYQVYWLNTATGIQDDFAFITAPDSANYLYENFQWKNIGTGVVTIIDGFPRDATTGLSVTLIDTSGGNICVAPDHVIPYSSGSGLTAGQSAKLMSIPTATEILEAAEVTPIHADIHKVLSSSITTGSTSTASIGY